MCDFTWIESISYYLLEIYFFPPCFIPHHIPSCLNFGSSRKLLLLLPRAKAYNCLSDDLYPLLFFLDLDLDFERELERDLEFLGVFERAIYIVHRLL